MLDGVVEKIDEDPRDERCIHVHGWQPGRQGNIDRVLAEATLESPERGIYECFDALPIAVQVHSTDLEAHQIEYVGDELGHFPRLGGNCSGELCTRFGISSRVRVNERAARLRDRRQRSAQVARY